MDKAEINIRRRQRRIWYSRSWRRAGPDKQSQGNGAYTMLIYEASYETSSTRRRAHIILTDGEDEGSDHKMAMPLPQRKRDNVILYVILSRRLRSLLEPGRAYYGWGYAKAGSRKRPAAVSSMWATTAISSRAAFQDQDELRTQYVAIYAQQDGTFRHITAARATRREPEGGGSQEGLLTRSNFWKIRQLQFFIHCLVSKPSVQTCTTPRSFGHTQLPARRCGSPAATSVIMDHLVHVVVPWDRGRFPPDTRAPTCRIWKSIRVCL